MQEWVTEIRESVRWGQGPIFLQAMGGVHVYLLLLAGKRNGRGERSKVASSEYEMPISMSVVKA